MFVRDNDRVDVAQRQTCPPQPSAELLDVESVVDQYARQEQSVARFYDQRVAAAARAKAADAQHENYCGARYVFQRSCSFNKVKMRSEVGERSGLPVESNTCTLVRVVLSPTNPTRYWGA